jgi:hypothetical protein
MSESHHAVAVTAEEVAQEFVATKLALLDVIGSVLGGDEFHIGGLTEWARESPVKLDDSDEAIGARMDRAWELHLSMMTAIGRHFLAEAARVAAGVSNA